MSVPARLRESVCEKKKTIRRTNRELTPKQNKTHTYIKKEKRERMVSKITFLLEKQNMNRTRNEEAQITTRTKSRKNVFTSDALQRGKRNGSEDTRRR